MNKDNLLKYFLESEGSTFKDGNLSRLYSMNFLKGIDNYFTTIPEFMSVEQYERYKEFTENFTLAKFRIIYPNILKRKYKIDKDGNIFMVVKCPSFPEYPFKVNDPRFEGHNMQIEFEDVKIDNFTSWINKPEIAAFLKTITNSAQRTQFIKYTRRFGSSYLKEDDLDEFRRGLSDEDVENKVFLYPYIEMYPNYNK